MEKRGQSLDEDQSLQGELSASEDMKKVPTRPFLFEFAIVMMQFLFWWNHKFQLKITYHKIELVLVYNCF